VSEFTLVKGGNVLVESALGHPEPLLDVGIQVVPGSAAISVDTSALIVGSGGQVQSGDDLVFYNQPVAMNGALRLSVADDNGPADRNGANNTGGILHVDVSRLPESVDRIVIAASVDIDSEEDFGGVHALRMVVSAAAPIEGVTRFVTSELDGFTDERALVVGELYRRAGDWKLRAVGQGYADGLAALVTDFGVEVDDPSEDDEGHQIDEAAMDSVAAPAASNTNASELSEDSRVAIKRRKRVAKLADDWRSRTSPYLARDESASAWTQARMFPASGISSASEQEMRATSVVLAVFEVVPELGKRVAALFGAPRGRIETFTEVRFTHANEDLRPDGLIRITRGPKQWVALVEVKTAKGVLRSEQVESYVKLARAKGFDAVVTISCDLLPTRDDAAVAVDARQLRTVALHHLAWEEVLAEASIVSAHAGVDDRTRDRVLSEFLRYGCDPKAGLNTFDDMGKHWVKVREGVKNSTISANDAATQEICLKFDQLGRHIALQLGALTGQQVTSRGPAVRADAVSRSKQLADSGELFGNLRIPGAAAPVIYHANLARERISCSMRLPVPRSGRTSTKVGWLIKQLDGAPPSTRVTAHQLGSRTESNSALLEVLRTDVTSILPPQGKDIREFTVTVEAAMGSKRSTDKGFVAAMTTLVNDFYESVVEPFRMPRNID
jgi:stress response protein SCP2